MGAARCLEPEERHLSCPGAPACAWSVPWLQEWLACGARGAGVPVSVERSGSPRPRRAAPLPLQIYHGKIKSKTTEPFLVSRNPRVEFVGSTTGKDNNISIVLKDVELSDAGKYTCHVKNPREKNAQHNATIILTVVHKSKCQPYGGPAPPSGGGEKPRCPRGSWSW